MNGFGSMWIALEQHWISIGVALGGAFNELGICNILEYDNWIREEADVLPRSIESKKNFKIIKVIKTTLYRSI